MQRHDPPHLEDVLHDVVDVGLVRRGIDRGNGIERGLVDDEIKGIIVFSFEIGEIALGTVHGQRDRQRMSIDSAAAVVPLGVCGARSAYRSIREFLL